MNNPDELLNQRGFKLFSKQKIKYGFTNSQFRILMNIFFPYFRRLRNAREKANTLHHIHADSGHHFPAKIVIETRNNYVISQLQLQLIT